MLSHSQQAGQNQKINFVKEDKGTENTAVKVPGKHRAEGRSRAPAPGSCSQHSLAPAAPVPPRCPAPQPGRFFPSSYHQPRPQDRPKAPGHGRSRTGSRALSLAFGCRALLKTRPRCLLGSEENPISACPQAPPQPKASRWGPSSSGKG